MNPLTQLKKILVLPLLIALALAVAGAPTIVRADAVLTYRAVAPAFGSLHRRAS